MTDPGYETVAPDAVLIEQLAREAIAALPDGYRQAAEAVALRVEDFAPEYLLDDLEIEDPPLEEIMRQLFATEATAANAAQAGKRYDGQEGKQAFLDKRKPDFGKFPRYP